MKSVTPKAAEATEIPQPVQWAVNIYAVETQRAAKTESDVADIDRRIAAAKVRLAELEADRDEADAWCKKHTENAVVAKRMAERECADHGWEMPEVPQDPPSHQTQAFPAQNGSAPAQTVPDRSVPLCKNCRKPIAIDRQDDWFHIDDDGGSYYSCYPDAVVSTEAEPVPAQPAPVSPDAPPTHTDLPAKTEGGA